MKKSALFVVVAVMFFITNSVFAGFGGLGKTLSGATGGGSGANSSDLSASKDSAVKSYLATTQELIASLEKSGEAFGVKKEVLEKLAAVNSLKEGNINAGNVDKAQQASKEAVEVIEKQMADKKELSAESQALLGQSMGHLAKAIVMETELVGTVQTLSTQAQSAVSSASPMEVAKLKGIADVSLTLAKALPTDLKLSKDILGSYMSYAKSKNISVPKDATALLGGE